MAANNIPDMMSDLHSRIAEIERRARNRRRTGVIDQIDNETGKYRVKISESGGKPFLTPWIKTRQLGAGTVKIDVLLKEGEQVDVLSESGDGTDSVIDMSTYSDSNGRDNTDTPFLITMGDSSFAISDGNLTLVSGTLTLKGDVKVEGKISCNDINIGDDHKHSDVMSGSERTGKPV